MSSKTLFGLRKAVAAMTMTATVLGLSGFAAVTPVLAATLPAGLVEGDVIRAAGDPDVYIVNVYAYKRLFTNPAIFNVYGHLGWDKVKEVSTATRDSMPTSGLFRNCETGDQKVYGLEVQGEDVAILHWVNMTGAEAVAEDADFFKKVFCINTAEFNLYTVGSEYDSLSDIPAYSRGGEAGATGDLQGSAGSLEKADFISSLDGEEVGEGESDVKIVGWTLGADDGSDLKVLSLKLEMEMNHYDDGETGSDDLDDYADAVSIWFDSTKVAEIDVADMNEDAGVWSKTISLPGDGVIKMDSEAKLYVAVDALDVIDSDDLGENIWYVALASLRYLDAEGAITTETTLDDIGGFDGDDDTRDFSFEEYGVANDLELKLSKASSNPEDGTIVEVDNETGEDGVLVLSGTLKADGSDFDIQEMDVDVGSIDDDDMVASFVLEIDGDEVQTLDSDDCYTNGYVCNFNDVDFTIDDGDSVPVKVYADMNGPEDGGLYAEGSALQVDLDLTAADVEDENGDDASGSLVGSVAGGEQYFYSEGIKVELTSVSESKSGGDLEVGTYIFKFDVSAFGSDAWVESDDACSGFGYTQTGGANPDCTFTTTATEDNPDEWLVTEGGDTESFTVTIAVEGNNAFARVHLDDIDYYTDGTDTALDVSALDEWESDALYLQNLLP